MAEAGYDYLLTRSRIQERLIRGVGVLLVVVGLVLLGGGIAYYVNDHFAHSKLGELQIAVPSSPVQAEAIEPASSTLVTVEEPAPEAVQALPATPETKSSSVAAEADGSVLPPVLPIVTDTTVKLGEVVTVKQNSPDPLEPPPQISASAIAAQQPYPGGAIKASYWGRPLEYEPAAYVASSLIEGFNPISPGIAAPLGTLGGPKRITVTSIGVDSAVSELQVMDLGDSRAYETPKHVVGHIPETANPGEKGSAWFFGHLESPIAREGNVFYNLPEVPHLLRQGEEVYAIVENGNASYLYKLTESLVVRQDQLLIDYGQLKELKPEFAQLEPGGANIHLVTCVPKWSYDYRLVVSGTLVGERR